MTSDISGEELNVGSGTEASAREIAERLIELVGADVEVEYQPDVRVLMRRRVGSNEKASACSAGKHRSRSTRACATTVDWLRHTS